MKAIGNKTNALLTTYQAELDTTRRAAENIQLTVDAEEDYEIARKSLTGLISRAQDSLDVLINLANDSEHPRMFEVLAGLLKTAGDLTNQLMDLQKRRHKLDEYSNPNKHSPAGGPGRTTNNTAIFVGSTPALQKAIQQQTGQRFIDVELEDD
jgi:hypothetical protein